MEQIYKYPRTRHLEGSRKQSGDEDLKSIPFCEIEGKYLVLEEKVDGANCGISFGSDGKMYLQSRGHFLNGGYGERQFDLFKLWAGCFEAQLHQLLGNRYIMYGEWLYAKHTVFYDNLTFLTRKSRNSIPPGNAGNFCRIFRLSTPFVYWSRVIITALRKLPDTSAPAFLSQKQ